MADSIPSLRRKVTELQEEIAALKVELAKPRAVKTVYVDNPDHIAMIRKLQGALNNG